MAGRARERNSRENRRKREAKQPKWLICCEGESELLYLKALTKEWPAPKPTFHFGAGQCQGVCRDGRVQLAAQALRCGNRGLLYDKIFVVFDADIRLDNRKDACDFNQAIRMLEEAEGVIPLWSNPCFEHWLEQHDARERPLEDLLAAQWTLLEGPCRQPCPNGKNCRRSGKPCQERLLRKPYYNGFYALGGLPAAKEAAARCRMQIEQSENQGRCNSRHYHKIQPGSTVYRILDELEAFSERINIT